MRRTIVFKVRGGGGGRERSAFLPPDDLRSGKTAARRLRKGHARPRRAIGRRSLQDLQIHAIKCADRKQHLTVREAVMRFGCSAGRAAEMIAALLEDKKLREVEPGLYEPTTTELTKLEEEKEEEERP